MATRGRKHGKAGAEKKLKRLSKWHPRAMEMIDALWIKRHSLPKLLKELSELSDSEPTTLKGYHGHHFREISWIADHLNHITKTGDSTALEYFAEAFGYHCKTNIERERGKDLDREIDRRAWRYCERPRASDTAEIQKWQEAGRSFKHVPMTLGALYKLVCEGDGEEPPIPISKPGFRKKLDAWGYTYLEAKRGKPAAHPKVVPSPAKATRGLRNKA